MERTHALGGLALGLIALVAAVSIAVAVTAEDSTPAQETLASDARSQRVDGASTRRRAPREPGRGPSGRERGSVTSPDTGIGAAQRHAVAVSAARPVAQATAAGPSPATQGPYSGGEENDEDGEDYDDHDDDYDDYDDDDDDDDGDYDDSDDDESGGDD